MTDVPGWGRWQSWIDAWNRHDLEAILDHYSDQVEFVSRAIIELGIDPAGAVVGKPALRRVFVAGLLADPELRFTPLHTFRGVGESALYYIGFRQQHVVEIHALDDRDKIIAARAYHGLVA
ncbi:MAG TPA: nuclear transport factor 2 family protein [Kofleriaceae bacterium]|nr:nuclear transport factor 2 family protein [Kofleriaceae bacterium]